jgi:DNA-binding transcriptional LysR family regulator
VALRAEALSQLGQEIAGAAGNIIVAASTIPAAYLLPAAMARLRTERAGISVTVQVSDSSGALAALRSRDCHLAVVGARERDRRIVYTPVATDEVLLVAHPEDPMAHRPMDLDALARVPIILREEGSGTRLAVAALLARRAALGIASPTVRVGSTAAARQCVLQGLGMSFISRLAVAEDLAAGRLVELPVQGTPVRRRFHAAQLREGSPSAAVAALIGCLCGDS